MNRGENIGDGPIERETENEYSSVAVITLFHIYIYL